MVLYYMSIHVHFGCYQYRHEQMNVKASIYELPRTCTCTGHACMQASPPHHPRVDVVKHKGPIIIHVCVQTSTQEYSRSIEDVLINVRAPNGHTWTTPLMVAIPTGLTPNHNNFTISTIINVHCTSVHVHVTTQFSYCMWVFHNHSFIQDVASCIRLPHNRTPLDHCP